MVLFWTSVVLVVAAGLGGAAALDRRARNRGHRVRSGGAINAGIKEARRDARAAYASVAASGHASWMSFFRRGNRPGAADRDA